MGWFAAAAAVFALAAVTFVVVGYRRRWGWTGFVREPASEASSKTLWDWLQLLVIPLGLAAVVFALNIAQSGREQRREDRRAALDRELAADSRREDAIAAYLDRMSELMLARGLLNSREGSQIRAVARTLTFSVLRRVDGRGKAVVVQFLAEAGLIEPGQVPIVNLRDADIRGIALHGKLTRASLEGADLRDADFRRASLDDVDLRFADMRRADFSRAILDAVTFDNSELRYADFERAEIAESSFVQTCMIGASFRGAAIWLGTEIRLARGRDVDFTDATFADVDFHETELADPNLTGVRFSGGQPPDKHPNPDAFKSPNCDGPVG